MYHYCIFLITLISLSYGNLLAAGDEFLCPLGCPRILDPICASDGANGYRYFHNECLMRYDMCRTGKAWHLTTMSFCVEQLDPIVRKECIRPCHFIYDPICATNGKSNQVFGNECVFAMENCLTNGIWIVARDSDCGF